MSNSPSLPVRLFAGSSEMHRLMSDLDWAKTPVGRVETWPQSLKSVVKTLLGSQTPMVLTWGEEFIQFYNDAYSKLLGDKHPAALGTDFRLTLAESWDVLGPMAAQVMRSGQTNWMPALPLLLPRGGCREEAYFSVSQSPVEDDDGQIVGMLAVCSEVTAQIFSERRLRLLGELGNVTTGVFGVAEAGRALIDATAPHALDVPFALLFRAESDWRLSQLGATGLDVSLLSGLETISMEESEGESASHRENWKARLQNAVRRAAQGEMAELTGLTATLERPAGLWNDRIEAARVMPLGRAEAGGLADVLVVGVSPNQALAETLPFHALLCSQIAAGLHAARAAEIRAAAIRSRQSTGLPCERSEALERGAQGDVIKPLEASELPERVEARLDIDMERREDTHQQVAEILESITDAFYALDSEFRFTYVNRQTESFFNRQRGELLGQVIWEEFPAACNTEFEFHYRAAMTDGQPKHFEALSPVFHRWIDVNVYPSARGISVYFRDVSARHRDQTERERLLREAQDASRVKDEFLAIVSHELRTPLNAILGWSNLIASGGLEEADQLRGLQTIERSARAQAQIIEDILDISRVVTGKMRLEIRPMPLQNVLETALETVRPAVNAKEIELIFEVQEPLGLIAGDAARLQQVFWNLLSNAVKFTPAKGRIWVGARLRSQDVEVAVSDSGRGIVPEFLPHVFERFRQGDMSSTREVGGLGLGLAIVRQIVELHGGSVEVQSEGLNQGATFFVSLPRLQNRAPGENEVPAPGGWRSAHSPSLQGLKVLVVDDELDAREVVAMLLQRGGAVVESAASSVEAMSAFGRGDFDLIVADIAMPGGDGYELIGKLRRAAISQGRIPVLAIALTAYTRLEDRQRALDAGFTEHIAKPINPDEFLRTISTLVATH